MSRPDNSDELGSTGEEREKESQTKGRDEPHVTEAEKKGSGQDDGESSEEGGERAQMPATAHGEDKHEPVSRTDPESMYENRPEEDKDVGPEDLGKGVRGEG